MNEVDRNAAFDKLEAFYDGVGMKTYDPIEKMGHKYGMESGSKETDQNFLFANNRTKKMNLCNRQ